MAAVTYRQAGDRHLLVEYGHEELDLRLNFLALAALGALRDDPPAGVVEAAPGVRSLLVAFDPALTSRAALLARLRELHDGLPDVDSLAIPSRRITLPIAFDDSTCREAVERYVATVRHDPPNTAGGSNVDFIVEQSGLADRETFYGAVVDTSWWAAFTGFFPGLPFLFPLRAQPQLFAAKYNPTRRWTAEGAVGIGGACVAIYPVESHGSYQLFGRTVPISGLIGPGDRVRFVRVSEPELLDARRRVFDDSYEYDVEEEPFVVAEWVSRE